MSFLTRQPLVYCWHTTFGRDKWHVTFVKSRLFSKFKTSTASDHPVPGVGDAIDPLSATPQVVVLLLLSAPAPSKF